MKPKISIVTLGVKDVEASRSFYEKMGFPTKTEANSKHVMFETEGVVFALFPKDELADDAKIEPSSLSGTSAITFAHNEPSKEDVDRVYQELLNIGAKQIKKPEDVFWGGYSGYIADPDGYLWEIAWNPFDDLT